MALIKKIYKQLISIIFMAKNKSLLTIIIVILVIAAVLVFTFFSSLKTVEEITNDDSYVGESVSVKGTVKSSFKLGELSGYTLTDKNGDDILVGTARLPAEGDNVIAKGILRKGPLGIGYYIEVEK